ncbi:hypothetical protein DXG01_016107 [Tephrocybe rancida]|nr:hypothetical protein DXG01_016107 [Tephrocybe rancida]
MALDYVDFVDPHTATVAVSPVLIDADYEGCYVCHSLEKTFRRLRLAIINKGKLPLLLQEPATYKYAIHDGSDGEASMIFCHLSNHLWVDTDGFDGMSSHDIGQKVEGFDFEDYAQGVAGTGGA